MPRKYERRLLSDGTPNPKFKPDARKRTRIDKRSRKGNPEYRRGKPKVSKFDRGNVIFWDGEGMNLNGKHVLVSMDSSDGFHVEDFVNGLDGHQVMRQMALWIAARPGTINVGFAFNYDTNMLLASWLKPSTAAFLRRDGVVEARGIRIEYLKGKWLTLKTRVWEDDIEGQSPLVGGKIYDVFGFFAQSFLSALKDYKIGTPEVLAEIAAMKAKRGNFTVAERERILAYNDLELKYGVELVQALLKSHKDANLPLKSYHGAGASASALLNRENVKDHMGPKEEDAALKAVRDAAQFAYFGGRFEVARYGHTEDTVYHADIRSAYPAAMPYLPCLACGRWTPAPLKYDADDYRFQLVRVRWTFDAKQAIYPFPFRDRAGRITYPSRGEGWYYRIEVNAAHRAVKTGLLKGTIEELFTWTYMTPCDHQPFAFMPEVYERRAALKKAGDGAEKALKLAINASYGALARRTGAVGRLPPFHQLEWAGWITSRTRALLFDEACELAVKGQLIMMCADALYSTMPLAVGGTGLGSWETGVEESITVVQSGVYWLGRDAHEITHFRGFSRGFTTREAIRRAWKNRETRIEAEAPRFITLGAAWMLDRKTFKHWATWREEPKILNLHPDNTTKRISTKLHLKTKGRPDLKLIDCLPNDESMMLEAMMQGTPHPLSWASEVPWRDVDRAVKAWDMDEIREADADDDSSW